MGNGGKDRFHPPTPQLFYLHIEFLLSAASILLQWLLFHANELWLLQAVECVITYTNAGRM